MRWRGGLSSVVIVGEKKRFDDVDLFQIFRAEDLASSWILALIFFPTIFRSRKTTFGRVYCTGSGFRTEDLDVRRFLGRFLCTALRARLQSRSVMRSGKPVQNVFAEGRCSVRASNEIRRSRRSQVRRSRSSCRTVSPLVCAPSFGHRTEKTPFLICDPSQPIFSKARPRRKLSASAGALSSVDVLRCSPTARIFCTSQAGASATGAVLAPVVDASVWVKTRRCGGHTRNEAL